MSPSSLIISIILSVLCCPLMVWSQVRPPNLSPDNLPDTAFTCEDKVTGGYYADVEADCQLFHVCVQVSEYEFQDFHFLCPNDTVFDQQHLVCTNWFEVDCHAQLALVPLQFFTNDFGIKRGSNSFEDEDVHISNEPEQNSLSFNQPAPKSRLRNTGRGQLEVGRRRPGHQRRLPQPQSSGRDFNVPPPPPIQDAEVSEDPLVSGTPEDKISLLASITGSTPIPLGFTTTIRPPRAIESSGGFLSGRNLVRNHEESHPEEHNEQDRNLDDQTNELRGSFKSKFDRDGRKPKVKANIRAKLAHSGKKKFFQKFEKPLKKSGRKVNLDHKRKNKIEFVEPQSAPVQEEFKETESDFKFSGPELRPDGRAPRVKSDIYAEHQQPSRHEPSTTTTTSTTEDPFIEPFFASPSSPQPFIFRGTPDPYGEGLLGSASTEAPFFPTIKSISQSDTPPQTDTLSASSKDELAPASDRFLSRPSPVRGRHSVRLETDQLSLSGDEESRSRTTLLSNHQQDQDHQRQNTDLESDAGKAAAASPRKSLKHRLRKNKISAFANSINDIDDGQDDGCNNPFDCPPKFKAAGRRPRVKSNLRARKRNFWQKNKGDNGSVVSREFGIGHGVRRGRKIRRGRKQRPELETITNQQESNEDQINEVNEIEDINESTLPFIPTTRTTTVSDRKEEFTTHAEKEEENEIFDDFFDAQNDFFVASSTISPVVFKGSPGPGFFSSPRPFYDNDGSQVSFTSPNPFGGPAGQGGRPSFNNIGAHIDLGPPKPQNILPPEQLLFISSTVSNKIFIGSEDETTASPLLTTSQSAVEEIKTEVTTNVTPKRSFPSFPIRGDSLSFNKPKLDFSRKTKSSFKFGRQKEVEDVKEREDVVKEQSDITSTEQSTTSQPETSSKRFFVDLTGGKQPRVKSNLLFNKRKFQGDKERFRKKLANLKAKASSPPSTEPTSTTDSTTTTISITDVPTTSQETVTKFKLRKKPLTFFRKVPDVSFTNALLKFKTRNKNKLLKNLKKPVDVVETTTEQQVDTTTASENLLSVETELEDDIQTNQASKPKLPPVRKASKAPANVNIRVEFKKKVEDEKSGIRGKFFINPDGRKPRVKSNIRAKFAHRGQHFGQPAQTETQESKEQETFDGASSQLDLTPFKENIEESAEADITEKREVNIAEAPTAALVNEISDTNDIKEEIKSKSPPPALQFSHELPLFPLQPVILNPRQSHTTEKPPLPASILKHINHITDIRSLPPLPPLFNKRFSKKIASRKNKEPEKINEISTKNSLLEQLVVNENSQSAPAPVESVKSIKSESVSQLQSPSEPSIIGKNKLSAFRALQKQVEKKSDEVEVSSPSHETHENLV